MSCPPIEIFIAFLPSDATKEELITFFAHHISSSCEFFIKEVDQRLFTNSRILVTNDEIFSQNLLTYPFFFKTHLLECLEMNGLSTLEYFTKKHLKYCLFLTGIPLTCEIDFIRRLIGSEFQFRDLCILRANNKVNKHFGFITFFDLEQKEQALRVRKIKEKKFKLTFKNIDSKCLDKILLKKIHFSKRREPLVFQTGMKPALGCSNLPVYINNNSDPRNIPLPFFGFGVSEVENIDHLRNNKLSSVKQAVGVNWDWSMLHASGNLKFRNGSSQKNRVQNFGTKWNHENERKMMTSNQKEGMVLTQPSSGSRGANSQYKNTQFQKANSFQQQQRQKQDKSLIDRPVRRSNNRLKINHKHHKGLNHVESFGLESLLPQNQQIYFPNNIAHAPYPDYEIGNPNLSLQANKFNAFNPMNKSEFRSYFSLHVPEAYQSVKGDNLKPQDTDQHYEPSKQNYQF